MSSDRKRISIYVSPRKHTELKTMCSRRGISMSSYVDKLIQKEADRERRLNCEKIKLN